MFIHCRKALPCNIMHTNQGPVKAFSSKSHVQTARESHDLNMDFAASNSCAERIPMQEFCFTCSLLWLQFFMLGQDIFGSGCSKYFPWSVISFRQTVLLSGTKTCTKKSAKNCKFCLIHRIKHKFWVLKRTVSLRRFFWVPTTYVFVWEIRNFNYTLLSGGLIPLFPPVLTFVIWSLVCLQYDLR